MRIGALRLKPQIFCGDEPAIGPGKAELLEAIDRERSISAAGRAMGMSYRRAWLLVDSLNRCWSERIVETSNAGAVLTPAGHALLRDYRALERALGKITKSAPYRALTARLSPDPLLPSPRPD
jgi:molybdate transport system regulatory protein